MNEPSGTVSPFELRTRIFKHVFAIHPVRIGRLRDHTKRAAEQVEVVHIGRAEIDLQRGEHVLHIDAEQLRLDPINVEIKLRRRCLEQAEDLLHARRLRGAAHHGEGGGLQGRGTAAGPVLDHHAKAAGIADAAHRWRRDGQHQRVLDLAYLAKSWRWIASAVWFGSPAR